MLSICDEHSESWLRTMVLPQCLPSISRVLFFWASSHYGRSAGICTLDRLLKRQMLYCLATDRYGGGYAFRVDCKCTFKKSRHDARRGLSMYNLYNHNENIIAKTSYFVNRLLMADRLAPKIGISSIIVTGTLVNPVFSTISFRFSSISMSFSQYSTFFRSRKSLTVLHGIHPGRE